MLDEAGDVTGLTLDIFRRIEARKKIAVGDPMQNIYSFNKTINAFNALKDEGESIDLTESFRVSSSIAAGIESFVVAYLDENFSFTGRDYPPGTEVTTKAYISRNNSGLMGEMFRLMQEGIPFHTTRKIDIILELPLVLANMGSGKPIADYKYRHIEKLRKDWERSESLQQRYASVGRYVSASIKDDTELTNAFRVLHKHGPKELNTLTKYARECAKKKCDLTLTTAHSSKGLEFSAVEIAPDLNEAVDEALHLIKLAYIENPYNADEIVEALQEELRLYYVACSRAMIELTNATCFPRSVIT
jgi:superfamily I DNA/RNA helicase